MTNLMLDDEKAVLPVVSTGGEAQAPQQPAGTPPPPAASRAVSIPTIASWLPAIGLLTLSVVAWLIIARTLNCTASIGGTLTSCVPHVPALVPRTAVSFATLQSHLAWGVTVLLAVLASAATLGYAIGLVGQSLPARSARPWQAALLGVALLLTALATRPDADPYSFAFNAQILGQTVYRVSEASRFVGLVESLGWAALAALGIGVSLVLRSSVREQRDTTHSLDARAVLLARRIRQVRTALLLGSIGLVGGAIESAALYSWAGSMLTEVAGTKTPYLGEGSDFAASLGLMTGALYSLMLAAVFAPALLIVRELAESLADSGSPSADAGERTTWLTARGLHASIPSKAAAAFGVLAPALAGGPLLKLLEAFTAL